MIPIWQFGNIPDWNFEKFKIGLKKKKVKKKFFYSNIIYTFVMRLGYSASSLKI